MNNVVFMVVAVLCGFWSCAVEVKDPHSSETPRKETKQESLGAMKEKKFQLFRNGPCEDILDDTMLESSAVRISTLERDSGKLIVKFGFRQACCQEFTGDYSIVNDTAVLKLEQVKDENCECFCWYSYTFIHADSAETFTGIKIEFL
jgi:hypothetical protein